MKIFKFLFVTSVLVLCMLPLYACDEQPQTPANTTQTTTPSVLCFADNSDINLTLGVEGQDKATFRVLNDDGGYYLTYDHNIIGVVGHTITAVGVGNTTLMVYANDQQASLNVVVGALPFCGDVSIEQSYTFNINGNSKPITPSGLNTNYGYGITYTTEDDIFEVSNSGVITPLSCGTGVLCITLVSGITNGRLSYTTLVTNIVVVDTPTLNVSILDDDENVMQCVDGQYVLYAMPGGTGYNLNVNYSGDMQDIELVNTLTGATLGNSSIENTILTQPFSVNQKCSFSVQYRAAYSVYNYSTIVYSAVYNVQVFVYILGFDINVQDVVLGGNVGYTANTLDLYLLKDTTTARADAANNAIFQNVNISIGTSSDTDGLYEVTLTDTAGAVTKQNGIYLVRPTTICTIVFVVTAINGGYTKTLTINVNEVDWYTIDFCDINETLTLGDSVSIVPSVSLTYAIVDISYQTSANIVSILNGVLTADAVGNADVTVTAGDSQTVYHLTVVDDSVGIYATSLNLDNGFDGMSINYQVGDGVHFSEYEQSVLFTLYAQNESVLEVDNVNIAVNQVGHVIEIYVGASINYVKAVLYSNTYDVYSQPYIWTRS